MKHDGCKGCRYERESENSEYCKGCKQNAVDKYVKKTNADRIKGMSVEELAEFLLKVNCAYSSPCMIIDEDCKYFPNIPKDDEGCKGCFKEWLESECDAEC